MKPNFFKYATNELSQDAFFCWLIEWSLESNKNENFELHEISLSLIKKIMPEQFVNSFKVKACRIRMQKKNTDFIIELNNSLILHFEDKVKSNTTQNQLSKYKNDLAKVYPNHKIYHIYLKTDLVWKKERNLVIENGYKIIDLIEVDSMLSVPANSDIYENFTLSIQQRISAYNAYKGMDPKNWGYNQWIGFVYDLSLDLKYHNFQKHYVGEDFWFVFSWFKLNSFIDSYVSFEIINKKCAIKVHVYDKTTKRIDVLNFVKELFLPLYNCCKTKVYNRKAKSMLVVEFLDFMVLDSSNVLDIEKTKEKLLEINQSFTSLITDL